MDGLRSRSILSLMKRPPVQHKGYARPDWSWQPVRAKKLLAKELAEKAQLAERLGPVAPPLPKEPEPWPDDGGVRREPYVDRLDKRVIRRVGWTNCLSRFAIEGPHRFFSPDVAKVRVCPRCKHTNQIAEQQGRAN